jgi:hypothetical protein
MRTLLAKENKETKKVARVRCLFFALIEVDLCPEGLSTLSKKLLKSLQLT